MVGSLVGLVLAYWFVGLLVFLLVIVHIHIYNPSMI